MLLKVDKKIISLASGDLPLEKEPFKALARSSGLGERFFLKKLASYRENGLMRKFTAVVNHRRMGFRHNAMVVWRIPQEGVEEAGRIMASFPEVSHCYQRKRSPEWNYNLYSMIHARTRKECLDVVRDISKKTGCGEYRCLFSSKEYKKSPVKFEYGKF